MSNVCVVMHMFEPVIKLLPFLSAISGKSLSDDQTAAASMPPLPHQLSKTQCQDRSTQCEGPSDEINPKADPVAAISAPQPYISGV